MSEHVTTQVLTEKVSESVRNTFHSTGVLCSALLGSLSARPNKHVEGNVVKGLSDKGVKSDENERARGADQSDNG